MANVEHRDIVEAELHQCKGISTAPNGTFQRATGTGTGVWVLQQGIYCYSTALSIPGILAWADLSLPVVPLIQGVSHNGTTTITINNNGVYLMGWTVNIGCIVASTSARAECRFVKNGVELAGSAKGAIIPYNASAPITNIFAASLSAGDTIKLQVYLHDGNASAQYLGGTGGVATTKVQASLFLYSLPT